MKELIREYKLMAEAYLKKLVDYKNTNLNVILPDNSTFKSLEDYKRFRSESLNELIKILQEFIKQLDKYGKFKTLDPKIIKMATMNALINGKFYDYAISHYNYRDIEPVLYNLIDNHFSEFSKLSREISELK